jgi:hypothetical protein
VQKPLGSHLAVAVPATDRQVLAWMALAVLLAYANAWNGVFQFDDYNVIVDNVSVHSWASWANLGLDGIRPLLKASYVLSWTSAGGLDGFHAFNLLVHFANTWLVFSLTRAWLRGQATSPLPGSEAGASLDAGVSNLPVWSALFFALHPAQTEAVTYVCGRSTSLMALFYLGGLACYVHTTGWRKHLLPAAFLVMALGVKETAVTFPAALLVWEISMGTGLGAALRKQSVVWSLLLLAGVFFLLSERYVQQMQASIEFNSLSGNVATQAHALMYLARQWLVPWWLNIDPDLPVYRVLGDGSITQVVAFAFALGWVVAAGAFWRRRPWVGFALGWAFLHWVPLYLLLPRLDVANDRQLYLAVWPLGMAVAVEISQLGSNGRRATGVLYFTVCTAVCIALAALTLLRNHDYRSEIALWEQTVKLSQQKSRVHNNLGYAYREADRLEDARQEYLRALWLDPNNVKARLNLRRLNVERAARARSSPAQTGAPPAAGANP